jgi:putative transposase
MYNWRKMSKAEREDAANYRRIQRFPKHSPPHFDSDISCQYLLTGTCYEHAPIIGRSAKRMTDCETGVLKICNTGESVIYAWCILHNHYHVLLKTAKMKEIRQEIGLFNGRTSFQWNGEDDARGRKVWHNCFERKMRSERHFFASLNYVLHNPVHHGYVDRWEDWEWSNATDYLESEGRVEALRIWKEYPILGYGEKWDV